MRCRNLLPLLPVVLISAALAACGDEDDTAATSGVAAGSESTSAPSGTSTPLEAPDASGCAVDDDDCKDAFFRFYGCHALNGEWRGTFSGGFGRSTIEGDIAVSIEQDGCDAIGSANFTGALCLSSGDIVATIEGDAIDGILADADNTVAFTGTGEGIAMRFDFEVLDGLRICRDIVGEAELERID